MLPWPRRLPALSALFLLLSSIPVALLSFLGFLGTWDWRLELAAHGRVQYLLALAASAAASAGVRRFRWAFGFGLVALVNLAALAPSFLPPVKNRRDVPFRAVSFNVLVTNENRSGVVRYLAELEPDLLLLQEVNRDWIAAAEPLRAKLPHWFQETREDSFGIALLSRHPVLSHRWLRLGEAATPTLVAELRVSG